MKLPTLQRRTLMLAAVAVPVIGLFVYVVLRSGPLAPVSVVAGVVESRPISPALFGIGTVEARFSYRIGPTSAGRVEKIYVDVGDKVNAGQTLAEMDPVDVHERIAGLEAVIGRAEASVKSAAAQLEDAAARRNYADAQQKRYEQLWKTRAISEVEVETRRQEYQVASAVVSAAQSNLVAAQRDLQRNQADRDGLVKQHDSLVLLAPVDGVIAARNAEVGTTVVAGEAVVEMIDPDNLWVNARFDQIAAAGLRQGLRARISLRSHGGKSVSGQVARVEVLADPVTEENLGKIKFDASPDPLPPIGELAEVVIALPELPALPAIPNAAVQIVDGRIGVWKVEEGTIRFVAIEPGASDLEGNVQIKAGLKPGDRIVIHSASRLTSASRIRVVDSPAELLK